MDFWRIYQQLRNHFVFEAIAVILLFLFLILLCAVPFINPQIAASNSCAGSCIPSDPILSSAAIAGIFSWILYVVFTFLRIAPETRNRVIMLSFVILFGGAWAIQLQQGASFSEWIDTKKLGMSCAVLLLLSTVVKPLYYQKRIFALLNRFTTLAIFAIAFLLATNRLCIVPGTQFASLMDSALEQQDGKISRQILQHRLGFPGWMDQLISSEERQRLALFLLHELEHETLSFSCQNAQSWSSLTIPNTKNKRDAAEIIADLKSIRSDFESVDAITTIAQRPQLNWPPELISSLEFCSQNTEASSFRCKAGFGWLILRSMLVSDTVHTTEKRPAGCGAISPEPTRYTRCLLGSEDPLYCSIGYLCSESGDQSRCLAFNWMYERSDPTTFDFVESSARIGASDPDLIQDMESAIAQDLNSLALAGASQGWCMSGAFPHRNLAFRIGVPSTGQNELWLTLFNPMRTGPVRKFYREQYKLAQDPYGCDYFASR